MSRTSDILVIGAIILLVLVAVTVSVFTYTTGYFQTEKIIEVSPTTKCIVVSRGMNVAVDCWTEN